MCSYQHMCGKREQNKSKYLIIACRGLLWICFRWHSTSQCQSSQDDSHELRLVQFPSQGAIEFDQKASPSFNQQKMGRVFSPGSWRCYNLPRGLSLKNSVLRYLPENNKEYLYENSLKPIKNLHRMNLCNTHFCSNWQGPVNNMRCLFLVAGYVCTKRLDWYSYLLPVLRKL